MQLPQLLNAITGGVLAGVLCWLLLSALTWVAPLLRMRRVFGDLVLNAAGEVSRKHLRRAERGMLLLGAAACAAVGGCVALLLLTAPRFAGVLMWVIFFIACGLIVVWTVFVVRGFARWRACRFAARADVALGASLSRLALQGHRTLNDVMLGQENFEHVVVGPRGLFVIRTVARRPPRRLNSARLNGGILEFQDGRRLTEPVAEVQQAARLLSELASRQLGHPLRAQPVLAVPGWEVAPDQAGEPLLVNEKTAVMLLGWSRPVDQLLDDDAPALQERLARLCVNRGL